MGDTPRDQNPAVRGLVFGLVSLGIHAGALVYHEQSKSAPAAPKSSEDGLEKLMNGFFGAMQEVEKVGKWTQELPSLVRTLQALDLAATAFAIIGVAYAAIAGHRGNRGLAMWLAWITSVIGLLLWAGHVPPGWQV